jgi:DNA-directed RNA polymerase specialized sigma subunit
MRLELSNDDLESVVIKKDLYMKSLEGLSGQRKRRYNKYMLTGKTMKEVGKDEGVSECAIYQCIGPAVDAFREALADV